MMPVALIDLLQRQGLHGLAAFLLRRALRRSREPDREVLQYRLALSLDALGRRHEAAACYAQAIDSVLTPWLDTRPQDRRPGRLPAHGPGQAGSELPTAAVPERPRQRIRCAGPSGALSPPAPRRAAAASRPARTPVPFRAWIP